MRDARSLTRSLQYLLLPLVGGEFLRRGEQHDRGIGSIDPVKHFFHHELVVSKRVGDLEEGGQGEGHHGSQLEDVSVQLRGRGGGREGKVKGVRG